MPSWTLGVVPQLLYQKMWFRTALSLSTTSGSEQRCRSLAVSPDDDAESLASVANHSVFPVSSLFSGQSSFSALELGSRHVQTLQSAGDESQALNRFERVLTVLHLAQGQLIVPYIIVVSVAWNSLLLVSTLFLK